jgi:hypothetical protein
VVFQQKGDLEVAELLVGRKCTGNRNMTTRKEADRYPGPRTGQDLRWF